MSKHGGDQIDRAVGQRISLRRRSLKMSQADLGKALGVSYQQIQKYESGANRVSASSIAKLANLLHVEAAYFFMIQEGNGEIKEGSEFKLDSQTFALNYAFARLKDYSLRQSIIAMIESIVETGL